MLLLLLLLLRSKSNLICLIIILKSAKWLTSSNFDSASSSSTALLFKWYCRTKRPSMPSKPRRTNQSIQRKSARRSYLSLSAFTHWALLSNSDRLFCSTKPLRRIARSKSSIYSGWSNMRRSRLSLDSIKTTAEIEWAKDVLKSTGKKVMSASLRSGPISANRRYSQLGCHGEIKGSKLAAKICSIWSAESTSPKVSSATFSACSSNLERYTKV